MAWLSGYTYRKKKPVNSTTAGAQTNYQCELLVGESSGASGEEIDCESHCQDFPNDIRFTGADEETKHDYWVESITGTTPNRLATVQIEVVSIPSSGAVDMYMYYGKSSDNGESNGDNTFPLFDDFNEGGSTGTGWNRIRNIDIKGNYAYITTNGSFRVVDISDPTNLNHVASLAISGDNVECKVSGNYAYITNGYGTNNKIHVISISDPLNPSITGSLEDNTNLNGPHGGWIDGDYFYVAAYTGDRFTIVDVTNKSSPSIASSINDNKFNGCHDIIVEGNYAYVTSHWGATAHDGSFAIVNVSNKSSPSIVGSIQHDDLRGGAGIAKKGNYIYVGAYPDQGDYSGQAILVVINVSNINSPTIQTRLTTGTIYRCRVEGDYLWTATGAAVKRYEKFDISTPASPSLVKSINHPSISETTDLAISGDYLFGTRRPLVNGSELIAVKKDLDQSWEEKNAITYVSDGYIKISIPSGAPSAKSNGIISKSPHTLPYILESRVLPKSDGTLPGSGIANSSDTVYAALELYSGNGNAYWHYLVSGSLTNTSAAEGITNDTHYRLKLIFDTSTHFTGKILSDAGSEIDSKAFSFDSDSPNYPYLGYRAANSAGRYDWFFIRKYAAPEPTWGTSGSEESAPEEGQPTMARWHGIPGMNYTGRRGGW